MSDEEGAVTARDLLGVDPNHPGRAKYTAADLAEAGAAGYQRALQRLIAAVAACESCGLEHTFGAKPCPCRPGCTHVIENSWASPVDGHSYRRRAVGADWLRDWAATHPDEGAGQ